MNPQNEEPDDNAAAQKQEKEKNYHEEIIKGFDEHYVEYKVFSFIPDRLRIEKYMFDPEVEKTTFLASFDPKQTTAGILFEALKELTEIVHPINAAKFYPKINKKCITRFGWKRPIPVYRVVFSEVSSVTQIIFCDEFNFKKIVKDFEELEFIKK